MRLRHGARVAQVRRTRACPLRRAGSHRHGAADRPSCLPSARCPVLATAVRYRRPTPPVAAIISRSACQLGLAYASFYLQVLRRVLVDITGVTGDALLRILATLANPHRLRVIAALAEERNYVSRLARELGISRALLQVHLRKLEAAELVSAAIEVSDDGKAMKFYEVTPFALELTPKTIMVAVRSLHTDSDPEVEVR